MQLCNHTHYILNITHCRLLPVTLNKKKLYKVIMWEYFPACRHTCRLCFQVKREVILMLVNTEQTCWWAVGCMWFGLISVLRLFFFNEIDHSHDLPYGSSGSSGFVFLAPCLKCGDCNRRLCQSSSLVSLAAPEWVQMWPWRKLFYSQSWTEHVRGATSERQTTSQDFKLWCW